MSSLPSKVLTAPIQLGVTHSLADGALNPPVNVVN